MAAKTEEKPLGRITRYLPTAASEQDFQNLALEAFKPHPLLREDLSCPLKF
jgi:hypothetical protein